MPSNRMIGAGYCILGGFAPLSGTFFKDIIPYSGLMGWSLSLIFFFRAIYYFGKQKSKELNFAPCFK